jgi:hypothetical protein
MLSEANLPDFTISASVPVQGELPFGPPDPCGCTSAAPRLSPLPIDQMWCRHPLCRRVPSSARKVRGRNEVGVERWKTKCRGCGRSWIFAVSCDEPPRVWLLS